jgi:large subunit ribosomal protein L22
MQARAVARQVGVPATKVRQVIDLIRNRPVEEALTILRFSNRAVAKTVEKTLRSAISNAINQDEENPVDADDLVVGSVFADEGRDLKRIRPRARGAAHRIRKRHSHITVIVTDETGPAANHANVKKQGQE